VQANCPQCTTRIQVDDTKVPDRPFKVRCPKCQAVLSLPGRTAAAETAQAAPAPPAPPHDPSLPEPAIHIPSTEMLERQERRADSHNDALVALSGPAAPPVHQALGKLGFNVDAVDDIEEGARLLEQGVYDVAVTARTKSTPGKPETLHERILRMPSETRRSVFVILVGDEFRSGDGTQAWAAQADLVIHPADAPRAENLIRAVMAERKRLYQPFLDARRKVESD
jgi:predicted Zn finger-like uncharacterized protein